MRLETNAIIFYRILTHWRTVVALLCAVTSSSNVNCLLTRHVTLSASVALSLTDVLILKLFNNAVLSTGGFIYYSLVYLTTVYQLIMFM